MQKTSLKIGSEMAQDAASVQDRTFDIVTRALDQSGVQWHLLAQSARLQSTKIAETHSERTRDLMQRFADVSQRLVGSQSVTQDWTGYLKDASQRVVLTMDALRERGDVFLEHEAAGCPPVLVYDYEIIVDGKTLKRPCNYQLLRILPPEGVAVEDTKRPYIIIDPRAGHGGGIGGFKPDSQVGVALSKGHPVYFVSFGRDPMPGQTLADVMHAEAGFVRTVRARHPDSPQPVVTGNCQGGWATLLMAACNPDLTGPLILNGAPVAPWSGEVGENPMRYNAGVLGGTWQPMLWSDLGAGKFDGANLVMNFEQLNPSRNYFGKYFDLYRNPEAGWKRFIDFERWWGGYFILNEAEIHWIVEQLFVGNRLVKNTAQLEPGVPIDIKAIKGPIFVFASQGDNITPPQQALNWIAATYADEEEIRLRGQRIIYMLHDEVGHLGIFVSSRVARKEHTELASTLETVEAMAPGLYEMVIENIEGEGQEKRFEVRFHDRTLEDLAALDDGQEDEASFAAVAHMSEVQANAYETFGRPFVRSLSTPMGAKALRDLHPLRVQRAAMSSANPMMKGVEHLAHTVREQREPAAPDNPFLELEKLTADWIEQAMDLNRDLRDAWYEATFFTLWGGPLAAWFGKKYAAHRTLPDPESLRSLPQVEAALAHMKQGGLPEAVVRLLILLGDSNQSFRAEILHRWAHVFRHEAPFKDLTVEQRQRMLQEQTVIVTFDEQGAIETLPDLLPRAADRKQAVDLIKRVLGDIPNPSPELVEMAQALYETLDLAEIEQKPNAPVKPAPRSRARKAAAVNKAKAK
jgi:pimeloyl-ACP methyl ester carboxylesterase